VSVFLANELILGEFRRTLDDRFRLTIPTELTQLLGEESADVILTKERPGCLSVWSASAWQSKLDAGIDLVKSKIKAGRLDGRLQDVQLLGRLLSTRHRTVQLAARGRLLVPEGFREFLGVEAGGETLIVGAAVCLEIWRPEAWINHLEERMSDFQNLFDNLSA
jgi:MraZ protein